jgi:BirA family biotin operon repressor/biotin-[acetyl-CoA-carboxylase] ligase
MEASHRLIRSLADGRFHSGEDLAAALGVTRAAVWKQLRRLSTNTGLQVHAVRGRGYRLAQPLELLDPERLRADSAAHANGRLERLWVLPSVDSTNSYLNRQSPPAAGRGLACLAEHQSAGRGRRGRGWVTPYGANLALSLAWRFDLPLAALSGLSLAVGVVLAETLQQFGLQGHQLKWPNDLHLEGRKLGGILVEARGEAHGPAVAVIGVGLNLRLADDQAQGIDQPWTDLASAGLIEVSRNQLAVRLLDGLAIACERYAGEGLTGFLPAWQGFDGYHGREVHLVSGERRVEGRYLGIDPSGALLLECDGRRQAFHAGEVSLRLTG